MKKNIIKILIILIIISFILALVGFLVNKKNATLPNNENKTLTEEQILKSNVDKLLKNVVKINSLFVSEQYSEASSYKNSRDMNCKKYSGEDSKEYVELIKQTYNNVFNDYSYFEVTTNTETNDEKLYVCFPSNCKIKEFAYDNFRIIDTKENNKKIVNFANMEYFIIKEGETWRFISPVINCS